MRKVKKEGIVFWVLAGTGVMLAAWQYALMFSGYGDWKPAAGQFTLHWRPILATNHNQREFALPSETVVRRADSLIPIKRKAASYGGNCVVAIGWDQCRDGYMAIREHGQQLLIEPVTKSLPEHVSHRRYSPTLAPH